MGRKKHQKKASASGNNGDCSSEQMKASGSNNTSSDNNVAPEIISDLFTCETSPIYGRYLRTKVAVKKGTLLLTENYLMAGPMRSSGLVCLGCNVNLSTDKKNSIPCPGCSWAICNIQCAKSKFHTEECKFFQEHQIQPPKETSSFDYGAILVLRGLLLKLTDKKKWQLLKTLESHNSVRQKLPLWEDNERTVVKPLLETFGLAKLFSAEEIHTVCGILEVNAFELGQDFSFRGVFPSAAMMAHDCIPNSTHFEDSASGVIFVRAATDIPPGTPITICYAYASEGTIERRQMMLDTKFFNCICNRCSDPYELGTNLSTLKCLSCGRDDVVNTKAKDMEISWQCQSCKAKVDSNDVSHLVAKYAGLSENVQGIKEREDLLRQCSKYFHPTHFIPFGLKFHLCQVYGREAVPLHDLSQADLERKLSLCQEVMQVLDVAVPGMTVTRGLVLYELQASEIILSRRVFESRKFSRALLKRKLESTLKILTEAVDILSLAHSSTPEYTVAMSAQAETLPDLKRWINIVKKSA